MFHSSLSTIGEFTASAGFHLAVAIAPEIESRWETYRNAPGLGGGIPTILPFQIEAQSFRDALS